MKAFQHWRANDLKKAFGLEEAIDHPTLLNWINEAYPLDSFDQQVLTRFQKEKIPYIDYLNEQELSVLITGRIMGQVNFETPHLRSFIGHEIKAKVNNELFSGKPDWTIAWGEDEPEKPFFFLQENKKSFQSSGEPMGQCLAAMIVAQQLKQDAQKPIYGAFVMGERWNFMILQDKIFSISQTYLIDNEDIFDVYRILKVVKKRVFEEAGIAHLL